MLNSKVFGDLCASASAPIQRDLRHQFSQVAADMTSISNKVSAAPTISGPTV